MLSISGRERKRVKSSIMVGDVGTYSAALHAAYSIQYDLENLDNQHIPITIHTGDKHLFDVATRRHQPTDKRLLPVVAAAR